MPQLSLRCFITEEYSIPVLNAMENVVKCYKIYLDVLLCRLCRFLLIFYRKVEDMNTFFFSNILITLH